MEKVFLDANILIDLVERRRDRSIEDLSEYQLFISPLSVHLLMYITKKKTPNSKISETVELFSLIVFDQIILDKALLGPTTDFEDNVQLHSAAEAECDIFLTEDKKLLDMKFFGKVRIVHTL